MRDSIAASYKPETIANLYQLRCALECEAVRIAIARKDSDGVAMLIDHLDRTEPAYSTCEDFFVLARMDEEFHVLIAGLSGNQELVDVLTNVNERIRYVRAVNLRELRSKPNVGELEGLRAHRKIVLAIEAHDTEAAVATLHRHIERRREEVIDLVKLAYSELYVPAT